MLIKHSSPIIPGILPDIYRSDITTYIASGNIMAKFNGFFKILIALSLYKRTTAQCPSYIRHLVLFRFVAFVIVGLVYAMKNDLTVIGFCSERILEQIAEFEVVDW